MITTRASIRAQQQLHPRRRFLTGWQGVLSFASMLKIGLDTSAFGPHVLARWSMRGDTCTTAVLVGKSLFHLSL